MDGPITVERLKCCDWSVHKFIEVIFSKLMDNNKNFKIDFVSIHYHLVEISCQIIECKIFMNSLSRRAGIERELASRADQRVLR